MDDLGGQNLGQYQIIAQLGTGAMATVYKAYHPTMDRYVAIKVLHHHLARDASFRARFLREARVVARLEHRYILPIYDFGEDRGMYYLVMRYVDGGPLSDLLNQGSLAIERAARLISQIGEALAYAHQRGVIHRDIKPANVLISREGDVFLNDFGIAKVVEETLQLTGPGQAIGTPTYMAPEQVQGYAVDARTDIYALGILFYQAVTGEVPFVAETVFSMALMHVSTPPRPPRQLNSTIPEALEHLILRAIAKKPEDRFQTVDDMVAALRATFDGNNAVGLIPNDSNVQIRTQVTGIPSEPTVKVTPPPLGKSPAARTVADQSKRVVQPQKSHNLAVMILFGSLAILIIITLLALNRNRETGFTPIPPITVITTIAATVVDTPPEPTSDQLLQNAATPKPTDALGVIATSLPANFLTPIALRSLMILRGHTGRVNSAAFSSNGKWIGTASWDTTARLWDATTGQLVTVLQGHEREVNSIAFSPDSHFVVTASGDGTARVWEVDTGKIAAVLRGHTTWLTDATFSPDGRFVVTSSGDDTARVWDWSIEKTILVLQAHDGWVTSAAFSPDGKHIATTSGDRTARVWDASTGEELIAFRGHQALVNTAVFSPDGKWVLTAGDNTARIWDASTGVERLILRGHTDGVDSAVFSPDATRIVTASADGTARIWDSETGMTIAELQGHNGIIRMVAFSPDGQRVITASDDGTARIWDVSTH